MFFLTYFLHSLCEICKKNVYIGGMGVNDITFSLSFEVYMYFFFIFFVEINIHFSFLLSVLFHSQYSYVLLHGNSKRYPWDLNIVSLPFTHWWICCTIYGRFLNVLGQEEGGGVAGKKWLECENIGHLVWDFASRGVY